MQGFLRLTKTVKDETGDTNLNLPKGTILRFVPEEHQDYATAETLNQKACFPLEADEYQAFNPHSIRIALDNNGQAHFWAANEEGELDDTELNPKDALYLITSTTIPTTLACNDPYNPIPHHYETDLPPLRYI